MTHTIEDIRRLVPELNMEQSGATPEMCDFNLLLTTRAQLEVARKALYSTLHEIQNGYRDPREVIREALAKINEME